MGTKFEQAALLLYFWESKGDLECAANFEAIIENFPTLKQAWQHYKFAETVVDALVKQAYEEAEVNAD